METPWTPHIYIIYIFIYLYILVGGFKHLDYFSIDWECHHPNWLSYFSEGQVNHQPDCVCYLNPLCPWAKRAESSAVAKVTPKPLGNMLFSLSFRTEKCWSPLFQLFYSGVYQWDIILYNCVFLFPAISRRPGSVCPCLLGDWWFWFMLVACIMLCPGKTIPNETHCNHVQWLWYRQSQ